MGQVFLSIAALLTLVCCSLDIESRAFEILLLTANFGYLVNLSAQTLSTLISFLFTPHSSNSHHSTGCLRKVWVNALSLLCIFGFPLSLTVRQSYGLKSNVSSFEIFGEEKLQRVACSFVPSTDALYFLFTPAVLLLLLQFVIICIALKRWSPSDSLSKGIKRQQRLTALLKTCLGQLLVWGVALIAILTGSNILWNIFTLCTALQSIFITTVCILSRAVVGAALASKYHSGEGNLSYHASSLHRSISEDDREMLQACQYKLADENERFYY